jgi:hypothetical protein
MTFPLDLPDLGEFQLGVGRVSTPEIPLGETGFTATVTVGAHNPLQLGNTRLQITPIVVGISRTEIEKRKKEKEDTISGMGLGGAAVGGMWGGLAGLGLFGVLPAVAVGGPAGGAGRGGIAGGQLGQDVGRALMAEQKFTARVVQGAIEAHFPLVYQPFLRLEIGYEGIGRFIKGWGELQTSLELDFIPALRLDQGTEISLYFENGRFSRASFSLAITGELKLRLNGAGRLSAGLTLLPIVEGDRKGDDPGVLDLPLYHSDVFEIIKDLEKAFQATTIMEFATGSDLKSKGHKPIKASPTGGRSFEQTVFEQVTREAMGKQLKDALEEAKAIRKGEADPEGWHAGTEDDPIPIVYYKPLEAFKDYFEVRKGARWIRLSNWPHREYEMLDADEVAEAAKGDTRKHTWKVGVHEKNVPHTRMHLVRTKSGSRSNAEAWKKEATAFGLDLGGLQVDHVKDLGLGGEDAYDNLWPIKEADNQMAGKLMYEQPVKWLAPLKTVPGGSRPMATTVGALPADGTVHLRVRRVQKGASE